MSHPPEMRCMVLGIGAWGPGFNNWPELIDVMNSVEEQQLTEAQAPKPEIIPPNERRRSPLPVKIAVETSWQALQQAKIPAAKLACVFGSGLGDTEITDYMCRALTTELKQLSPTKFHNSVHNAAAGYWTISTNCNKAANSIAAYHNTAALALLEGISQCIYQNEPVLITLFDTKAHSVYQNIFDCRQDFSAAIAIAPHHLPQASQALCELEVSVKHGEYTRQSLANKQLETLYQTNPAAKLLELLNLIGRPALEDCASKEGVLPLSNNTYLSISRDLLVTKGP